MKLYDMKLSPNARRVRIFLAEKGVKIDTEECLDEARGCLKSEYLSRYPYRLVPMLELPDGTQLGESTAICRYLEELHPEPNLWGRGALERAQVEMWQQRVQCDGEIGAEEMFRNTFPPFVNRGLAGSPDPVPQIPALVQRGRERFARFVRILDCQLASNTYVAGPRYSMADISALCALDFGKFAGFTIPSELTNVSAWYARMNERPAAQA